MTDRLSQSVHQHAIICSWLVYGVCVSLCASVTNQYCVENG